MAYNYYCFNLECRKNCDLCSSDGIVSIEEKDDYQCPHNESPLKHIGETAVAIKTPTRDRFLDISRKKRNKDHFKKEIMPSMTDQDSLNHHINKLRKNS